MLQKIDNINLPLGTGEDELYRIAERSLGGKPGYFRVLKKSLDARKRHDIKWVYSIEFDGVPPPTPRAAELIKTDKRVVIIGSGPAGLFCAVRLADRGVRCTVIERGEDADKRAATIKNFAETQALNPESNVQFGEGGAGTFSDGKLNTQTHSGYNREVLAYFARFGAPPEVEYLSKPHIGSDNLPRVVKNMREFIISRGGEVLFNTKLVGIRSAGGGVRGVTVESGGASYELPADIVVLAVGHSARDTFVYLQNAGLTLEPREFAVGVRIEHLRHDIDTAQYGKAASELPAADYKLVSHAGERSCFTFCMCPGGVVMPSASEHGGIVTNGMSRYARNDTNSNSALLVQVKLGDFALAGMSQSLQPKSCMSQSLPHSAHLTEDEFDANLSRAISSSNALAGMRFQRVLEQAAYNHTRSYSAPAQLVGDFLRGKPSHAFGGITPSYPRAVPTDLRAVLPKFVTNTLAAAIPDMAKRLKGFDTHAAVLTAVESRFSSPIRLPRRPDAQSVDLDGLYPCGEGSGHSGGITTSAADGLSTADLICLKV